MDDVHQRRTRPGTGQGATMPGVPSSPQHSRDERMTCKRGLAACKTRKSTSSSFACQRIHTQRSCGALVELLVCATASHEKQYGPCETPVQNESSHAVFGAKQATGLLIKSCSTSS